MQHLLPLVWDKAVERWEARVDNAALQIDLEDLHALPGWKSPDGPLTGTLNERADAVLRAGVEMGASQGGGLDKEAVERLLRVAFCCLAQLDDRGNVVRDFATLDGMLEFVGDSRSASRTEGDLERGLAGCVRGFRAGNPRQC